MAYSGLLKKVWDNAKNWSLVIEVDDYGERKFNLWDKKYAGEKSDEHEPICDVHNWEGMRVVFDATKGKPKGDGTDDCWPSTIDMIRLEGEPPTKSVREMAEEITAETLAEPPLIEQTQFSDQVPVKEPSDNLRALTMAAIDADLKAHEARAAMLLEVERIAREA